MKKFFIILVILIIGSPAVFADGDLWDNYGDHNFYGQKPVSDKEFNSVLEKLKGRKNKHKKKNEIKGGSINQSNESKFLNEVPQEHPVLLVPLRLKSDRQEICMGHYQVVGKKLNGKPFLLLYQSEKLMAQIPAVETKDDFNEKEILFVRLLDYNHNKVRIIYGSIDMNAYAIVDIAE